MGFNFFHDLAAQRPAKDYHILAGQQYETNNSGYTEFCRVMASQEDTCEYFSYGKEEDPIERSPVREQVHKPKPVPIDNKPQESYAYMIYKALESSPDGKLTLSDIYAWIEQNYTYYRTADPVWKNSIRHNLSLNVVFKKIARPEKTKGKGGFWAIDYECQKDNKISKKRRVTRPSESSSMSTRQNENVKLSANIFKENAGNLIF